MASPNPPASKNKSAEYPQTFQLRSRNHWVTPYAPAIKAV